MRLEEWILKCRVGSHQFKHIPVSSLPDSGKEVNIWYILWWIERERPNYMFSTQVSLEKVVLSFLRGVEIWRFWMEASEFLSLVKFCSTPEPCDWRNGF